MSARPWGAVLALAVLLPACTAPTEEGPPRPSRPEVLFPVADTRDDAEEPLGGRLVLQGQCLLISRVGRKLAIWPRGTSFRPGPGGGGVLRKNGEVLRQVGGWVWGETASLDRAHAERLVGRELPRECGGKVLGDEDFMLFASFYDHPLPEQADVLVPVANTLGVGDAGVNPAPLEIHGDCVLLGGRLFVWPWWTSFRSGPGGGAIVDERDGGVILRVGERILDGGGGAIPRGHAELLVGYALPQMCGDREIPGDEDFFFIDRIATRAGWWEYGRPGPGSGPA